MVMYYFVVDYSMDGMDLRMMKNMMMRRMVKNIPNSIWMILLNMAGKGQRK